MSQRGQQLPLNVTARSCIRSRLGRFLMPQSLFWFEEDTRGSEMLPGTNCLLFYRYRELFFHA
jgi:hypothetical protein